MPLAFHSNRPLKAEHQYLNAKHHIVPFVEENDTIRGKHVLEIGCGEGGVMKAFLDRGCTCVGVDLSGEKIAYAENAFSDEMKKKQISFIAGDIYDPIVSGKLDRRFDIVILKDTLEHIVDHDKILSKIRDFLRKDGVLFISFPPWRMPYGGHQQMADSRLGKLPYIHTLPRPLYRGLLRLFGESKTRITNLMSVVDTRLSIHGFQKLLHRTGYRCLRRQHYLINPIYEYKFGLKPVKQFRIIDAVPWLRDFITMTCYYLIQPEVESPATST